MKIVNTLILLVTISCGRAETDIDPRLEKDFKAFVDDCNYYSNSRCITKLRDGLKMLVTEPGTVGVNSKTGAVVVGMCKESLGGGREVVIDSDYANKGGTLLRTLIYHELGHCLLDREHDQDKVIMQKSLKMLEDENDWEPSVKELFDAE